MAANEIQKTENPLLGKLFPNGKKENLARINEELSTGSTNGTQLFYTKLKVEYGTNIDKHYKKITPKPFEKVDGYTNWESARDSDYRNKKLKSPFTPECNSDPSKFPFTDAQKFQAKNIDQLQKLINANPGKKIEEIYRSVLETKSEGDPKRIKTSIEALDRAITTNKDPLINKIEDVINKNLRVEQTHLDNLRAIKEAHQFQNESSLSTKIYDPLGKEIDAAIERTQTQINNLNDNKKSLATFVENQKLMPFDQPAQPQKTTEKNQTSQQDNHERPSHRM